MGEGPGELEELQRQLAYYRKRVDEQAGRLLQADYAVSGFQHEILQKRQGFALLSRLQSQVTGLQETSQVLRIASESINSELGMDRTLILVPSGVPDQYEVLLGLGFQEELPGQIAGKRVSLPSSFADGSGLVVVNKATPPDSLPDGLIGRLRDLLGLPYLVCLPITGDAGPIGILLTGRSKEVRPLFPPLGPTDVETFSAIAGLVSATVKNMRVAALQEMDRLKTEFFANISHEFRTPITLTLGPLEGLLDGRYGPLEAPARAQAELMLRNQRRLLDLINQILDLAKLESGKMLLAVSREPNLNRMVVQTLEQFRAAAEKRYLALVAQVDPAVEGCDLYIDSEKLERVLFNLLSNAVKFTRAGRIEVLTELEATQVRIEVRDSGIGIRADQLPYIFDRFRQADGSASREHAGTGIGLALVSEVVKLHGGAIQVQSEVGKGSTFIVRLPLGRAHLDPASIVESPDPVHLGQSEVEPSLRAPYATDPDDPGEKGQVDSFNLQAEARFDPRRPTLLYVDDNADLRDYVRGLLSSDYNLFLAGDGEQGWSEVRKRRPDLVLSDWMMPRCTGPELCARIRADRALEGTPFVLLTAKSSVDSKLSALEGGADDYLSKPFSAPELLARVRNLVALRQQALELKKEMAVGGALQRALLPPQSQWFGDATVDVLYRPRLELSGDSYDVIHRPPHLYFYLAQARTHGITAAQVTLVLRDAVRAALEQEANERSLSALVDEIRERCLARALPCEVGFHLARFNRREKTIELARSRCAPAFVLTADGRRLAPAYPELQPLAASLSRQAGTVSGETEVRLERGDRLFLFGNVSGLSPEAIHEVLSASSRGAEWRAQVEAELERGTEGRDGTDLTVLRLSIA